MPITIELPEEIEHQLEYTAWLFAKKTDRWEGELRLPIIQAV